jgi:hypothetical protein
MFHRKFLGDKHGGFAPLPCEIAGAPRGELLSSHRESIDLHRHPFSVVDRGRIIGFRPLWERD